MKPIEHAHALRHLHGLRPEGNQEVCEAAANMIVELVNENERLRRDADRLDWVLLHCSISDDTWPITETRGQVDAAMVNETKGEK